MPDSSHDSRLTIHEILKQFWGYDSFRPLQDEIINSILVRKKNITAYAIYSGMSRKEVINTLKVAANSNCKFLYVSPERLETFLFKEYLPALRINLIAVDEAHCISQWGYDFRPPYLRIAALREEIPNIPLLALTASATTEVQNDICDKLQFKAKSIFRQPFERPNLSYSVFKVDSRINKIIEILKNVPGSGIVYCKSRKRTKEIADLIKMHGISADFYHAGLIQAERNRKQEEWITNQTRIIVCTNAFGMGIDKPDVRVVIHADSPDCLENYYQEAGRAGRDGKTSYAVLLHGEKDIKELEDSIQLRYPSIEEIRQVYQSISNYLQIPSGSGEGQYYDFELTDFIKKFKLNSHTALYSLKALEQDGWMSFNEQVFLPSTVQFTTGKEYLYQFEKDHSQLEPLIKTLLRAYEGIFEYPASISENILAYLLQKNKNEIKKELGQLHGNRIIEYTPQKDSPQLLFLRNRVKTEDLSIDVKALNNRKEKFISRIDNIIRYIHEAVICRSKIIASYFGDQKVKDCGICDNCLRQKSIQLSREEFESINLRIVNSVKEQSIHTKELLQNLKGIKKEKAWKVISFLQAENKIELDKTGWIHLK